MSSKTILCFVVNVRYIRIYIGQVFYVDVQLKLPFQPLLCSGGRTADMMDRFPFGALNYDHVRANSSFITLGQ